MIAAANTIQTDVTFVFVETSQTRRYQDLAEGKIDALFFESPDWGWAESGVAITFTEPFLYGGEVYIAANIGGRTQAFFDDLTTKRIGGIRGYHYGFADFVGDPKTLQERFEMTLASEPDTLIRLVLSDRVDVSVVTQSYLFRYLVRHPHLQNQVLVSDKQDQEYQHRVLMREGGPLTVEKMEHILSLIENQAGLNMLFSLFANPTQ